MDHNNKICLKYLIIRGTNDRAGHMDGPLCNGSCSYGTDYYREKHTDDVLCNESPLFLPGKSGVILLVYHTHINTLNQSWNSYKKINLKQL